MFVSFKKQVLAEIKKRHRGRIFFPGDFNHLGNYDGVKLALSRLAKEEVIVRLGNGIYCYPKTDPELGLLLPSMETIAAAIARRDKIKIKPTGDDALNKLGLSTQVPMKPVYLTDGPSKVISIGEHTITFKGTTSKRMAIKPNFVGMVVLAMEEIGNGNMTADESALLQRSLQKVPNDEILKVVKDAPSWISTQLVNYLNSRNGKMAATYKRKTKTDHRTSNPQNRI